MSGITLSSEFDDCATAFGWDLSDMEWLTLNAAKSTFYEFDERLAMINTVIKPGYAALRASHAQERLGGLPSMAARASRAHRPLVATVYLRAAASPPRRPSPSVRSPTGARRRAPVRPGREQHPVGRAEPATARAQVDHFGHGKSAERREGACAAAPRPRRRGPRGPGSVHAHGELGGRVHAVARLDLVEPVEPACDLRGRGRAPDEPAPVPPTGRPYRRPIGSTAKPSASS